MTNKKTETPAQYYDRKYKETGETNYLDLLKGLTDEH